MQAISVGRHSVLRNMTIRRLGSHGFSALGQACFRIAAGLSTSDSHKRHIRQSIRTQDWVAINGDTTLRLDYPLTPSSRVIDGGGFEGNWSRQILRRYDCNIEVYEPLKEFAEPLSQEFAGDDRVDVVEAALWIANTTIEMTVDADSSSLVNRRYTSEKKTVQAIDCSTILARPVDLLKLNVEGAEFEILEHLVSTGTVGNVNHIQVQFHDFHDDAKARRETLRRTLRSTHNCDWCVPWVWESWSRKGS